ncbi:aminotransferase class V-fold PLP-dependent enzyme [Membranihabitans marinus]|uniref:aminotransferase class V-fold PLP-dependent enzyme n=1 Tax=Membranihabitans marinus TaxID=1227546 RepID=UPI001F30E2AE|nr:aminotransferase class V-fold PLP-dependent enzyme [Membranihabitans marinus]
MSSRRNFIRNLSVGLPASIIAGEVAANNYNPQVLKSQDKDEAYWSAVRSAFPLTKNRVYLNNGTFGPSPYPVMETIQKMLWDYNERGEYGHTSEYREKIAQYVKVKSEEISLTHNTTEGINVVVWGLPLKRGDEVIITKQEHVGNALPWLNRAKLDGIVLKTIDLGQTAAENLQIIEDAITSKTRVIAIPHISCTYGLVLPIKEISAMARSKGIFTAVDGAHGSGTFDLDLRDLGCDTYSTSCHKWMLGPNGTGFLYVREELLDTIQAYWVGSYSDTGWDLQNNPPSMKGYVATAHRYDFGSQSAPLYAGVDAAIDFMMTIGQKDVEARVRELSSHLQRGLLALDNKVEMITPVEDESKICMIGFRPRNMDYLAFNKLAQKNHFRIRVVPEGGLNSIRISTHIYNSKAQIDDFLAMVEQEA